MRPLIVGNFLEDSLGTPGGVNSAVTSCAMVGSTFGSPTYRVVLAFDPDTAAHELVRCTVAGSSITQMERGFDGTTAQAHSQTAVIRMVNPAKYLNDTYAFMEDGWVPVPDYVAATFASATSFTLAGDWTAVLGKGDKLRLSNVSTKYGHVASASFASSVTTVSLVANTDYSLASGAVASVYYSKLGNPAGFPSQFNWNPNPTGYSVAPAGTVARYSIQGGTCTYAYYSPTDGTSNSTSRNYTLPIIPLAGTGTIGVFLTQCKDNAVNAYGKHVLGYNSQTATCYPSMSAGTWTASGTSNHVGDGIIVTYPI